MATKKLELHDTIKTWMEKINDNLTVIDGIEVADFEQLVNAANTIEDKLVEVDESVSLSKDWANKTGSTVDGTEYSAKKYATDAKDSEETSVLSATVAGTKAVEANTSVLEASTFADQAYNSRVAAKSSEDKAKASELAAKQSETNAAGSATTALGYRNAAEQAATVATGARNEAIEAKDDAVAEANDIRTNWQDKLDAAAQYALDAEEIKTEIRNWYYGPLEADPVTRPDGTAIQVGDEYHDSVNHVRKVYDNGAWVDVSAAALAMPGGAALVGFKQDGTGTVNRQVQDKLREFLSVKDFGAVGDGLTDDTAAIQLALDSNNPTILFSAGVYLVTSKLIIKDNTHIIGQEAILLNKFTSTYNVSDNCIFGDGISNVVLEGLVIDGGWRTFPSSNATDTLAGNSLIKFTNCKNIEIRDCWWKNYTQAWGGQDFTVVKIEDSEDVRLINNRQSDVYPEGARINSCVNVLIDGFTVDNKYPSIVWTPLHLFYCDRVVAQNINITAAGNGSSFNATCSNFVLRDINIVGGAGLDMSNETATPYQVKNGVVENVNIIGGSIYSTPTNGGPLENVELINCKVDSNKTGNTGSNNSCLRLGSPLNVLVNNCKFNIIRGDFPVFTSAIRADLVDPASGNLKIVNLKFTGDVDSVVQINPNSTHKNFKGLFLSGVVGALSRNPSQGSFTGNGSIVCFTSSITNEDNESFIDDIKIERADISNLTGGMVTIYNVGHILRMTMLDSKLSGSNDRSTPFPSELIIKDTVFDINLCVGGNPARLQRLSFEGNNINTPIDPSSFINLSTSSSIVLENVNISRNSFSCSRFINNVNGTVSFDPASCKLEFDLNLISGTSIGTLAARNFVLKSGSLGYLAPTIHTTTANRVISPINGQCMFDSTLGKPIWWNGSSWVDATGAAV